MGGGLGIWSGPFPFIHNSHRRLWHNPALSLREATKLLIEFCTIECMQLTVSPTPLVDYRGQDSDFDELMEVPIRRFGSMDDLHFELDQPARYIVLDPRYSLPLDLLFIPRDPERLLVGFHGAESRAVANFPKFQFVKSFSTRSESLLFVSDSTLLQGDKINIGWLAGNRDTPLAHLVSRAVRSAGEALGVKQTVLIGHSAGGFSAVLVGSQVPNSRAISVNGQSVVDRYEPWTVRNLHRDAFPDCDTIQSMMARYAHRLDLREALKHRLPSSSFTYFGNRRDQATFGRLPHFPLLAESFGLTEEGGVTDHGDSFVIGHWGSEEDTGHALPGTMLPFIELVLGEEPSLEIPHTADPQWIWSPNMAEPQEQRDKDFDRLSDAELFDAGMYRCKCGGAVYPNGDPDQKHCTEDIH